MRVYLNTTLSFLIQFLYIVLFRIIRLRGEAPLLEIIGMILFWLVLIAGILIIPFNIAGTFIIAAAALIYGLITGFAEISVGLIVLLLAMALGMELLEAFYGALLAKKFGGSRWGMTGAIVGGFIGAVAGTPVTPVFGTLVGAFLGSFLGAMTFEFVHENNSRHAFRVGLGAFLGAISGKITKILVAIVMVIIIGLKLV